MHNSISTLVCFEQETDNRVQTGAVAVIDLDGLKKSITATLTFQEARAYFSFVALQCEDRVNLRN
jgi:hypothetical protein